MADETGGGEVVDEDRLRKGLKVLSSLDQVELGLTFRYEVDLMYELSGGRAVARPPPGMTTAKCQLGSCPKHESIASTTLLACAKCGSKYCSRDCQVKDWKKGGHKYMCQQLKALAAGEAVDRRAAVARILTKVRLYLCPFGVAHEGVQGPGFVFVQSPNSVLELHYFAPVNSAGQPLSRSILMHYLTMGEYIDAVMQDDFELGTMRPPLEKAIEEIDVTKEVVVLFKARCGFVALLTMPLVPDVGICRTLGQDYVDKDALQLNLDDV